MSNIFFLVLRRLRAPLILLISVYAIATLGMTLIPGQDLNGEPWRMSFFHAFYFVSFMGTTIGFGEVPYEFTDSQRAWVLICIYTSVVSWLYCIGNVLRLLQDSTFINAVSQRVFKQSIHRIDTPFYITCGYGETGQYVIRGLSRLGIKSVIIDINDERTHTIEIENLEVAPIVLTADVTEPNNLIDAGINHPFCKGVIALTQDDHTNLKIAVAAKLINPRVTVICRSEVEDEAKNMASFGTDHIINPFMTFGRRISLLTQNPALHRIHNWFINQYSAEEIEPNIAENGLPHGKWIVCGYGRFGKAVHQFTDEEAVTATIIDVDPIKNFAPKDTIVGRGTEAETLNQAGIESAVVVVAASNDDANNLSTLMTAKQLNPNLIAIARVNNESNYPLFKNAHCNYIMRSSQVVANEALTIISRPLVTKFLQYSSSLTQEETTTLISEINLHTNNRPPMTWRLKLSRNSAPAIVDLLENGQALTVADICSHPKFPQGDAIPLLLLRNGISHLRPKKDMALELNDQLLLCGRREQTLLAQRLGDNTELLDSLINNNVHHIPLIRWLKRRQLPQQHQLHYLKRMKHLHQNLYVAGQIIASDFASFKQAGIKAIINNRPDNEEPGQLSSVEAKRLATAHGINYHYLPMANGQPLPPNLVNDFKTALESESGAVLTHCRSGMRSSFLWALGQIPTGSVTVDEAINAAQQAGIPLANARAALENAQKT